MPITISGSTGIAGVDGSASTPAIQGTDTNTGVTFPAADTIAIATGGTERMRIDSSGNVGIGTSSPLDKLHVAGNARLATLSGSGVNLSLFSNGQTNNNITLGQGFNNSTDNIAFLYNRANADLVFGTNNTERARIDSSGNLLVGTTDASVAGGNGVKIFPSGTNSVGISINNAASTNGDAAYRLYSTGAAAYRFYVGYGGTIYATNTTVASISDVRQKENIRDLDVGLDEIMALKPRKFDWKEGKGKNIKDDRGWIAQEFEQVFPDMIDQWLDPAPEGEEPYKAVRADLIPVLVKAIQEQQSIIEDLKARITALEAK